MAMIATVDENRILMERLLKRAYHRCHIVVIIMRAWSSAGDRDICIWGHLPAKKTGGSREIDVVRLMIDYRVSIVRCYRVVSSSG
jgi:hypothetical protein